MPELLPIHRKLTRLAGGSDRAARFLSTWCPPRYLGGCSVAARADGGAVRLVRNYDLSPDLNEGLLLRTEWSGRPVMGMIEFLWGLSDGINADGLAVALASGGRSDVAPGFGVTTILRYVLETCATVDQALPVLSRVPSHMAYNVVLADSGGATASIELAPGGGARRMSRAIATNHQHGPEVAERADFTRTVERRAELERILSEGIPPDALGDVFLKPPLHQRRYPDGFGTLFTCVYDPPGRGLALRWPGRTWHQSLPAFTEGRKHIRYAAVPGEASRGTAPVDALSAIASIRPFLSPVAQTTFDRWAGDASAGHLDWARLGAVFAGVPQHAVGNGCPIIAERAACVSSATCSMQGPAAG